MELGYFMRLQSGGPTCLEWEVSVDFSVPCQDINSIRVPLESQERVRTNSLIVQNDMSPFSHFY